MTKEDIIEIINTIKWSLIIMGIWITLFVGLVFFIHRDVSIDNKIETATKILYKRIESYEDETESIISDFIQQYYNHIHRYYDGKVMIPDNVYRK